MTEPDQENWMLNAARLVAAVTIASTVLLSAPTAAAQGGGLSPVSFGVSGGVAIPMADLSGGDGFAGVNTGYNVTGSIGLGLPALPFSLRGDIAYNSFGSKDVAFPTDVADPGYNADARVLGFTANVVVPINLPAPVLAPYLIGGIGDYNVKLSPTTGGSTSQSKFGFNIGAGVKLPLVVVDAFVEARYHRVNDDNGTIAFFPITVGVMF